MRTTLLLISMYLGWMIYLEKLRQSLSVIHLHWQLNFISKMFNLWLQFINRLLNERHAKQSFEISSIPRIFHNCFVTIQNHATTSNIISHGVLVFQYDCWLPICESKSIEKKWVIQQENQSVNLQMIWYLLCRIQSKDEVVVNIRVVVPLS